MNKAQEIIDHVRATGLNNSIKSRPNCALQFMSVAGASEAYIDLEFYDRSSKSAFRLWTLSIDTETAEHFATLARSETPDGEFLNACDLPKKFSDILLSAVELN